MKRELLYYSSVSSDRAEIKTWMGDKPAGRNIMSDIPAGRKTMNATPSNRTSSVKSGNSEVRLTVSSKIAANASTSSN